MKKLLLSAILALGAIICPPVQAQPVPPIAQAQPVPPIVTCSQDEVCPPIAR